MKVNSFKSILVFLFLVFVTEVCFADLEYGLGANFVVKNNKLIVYGVHCETPAHKYGLQSGDVIVKYNDVIVNNVYSFFTNNFVTGNLLEKNIKQQEEIVECRDYILKNIKVGDTINLEILRSGKKILKSIKIEEMPKKLPYYMGDKKKFTTIKGGATYFYGEKFLLWQQSSKTKKWISEIPTLNDSCVYKIGKYYKNEFEDLGIKTIIGETIEYSPISHTVVAVKAYCETFTERSKASFVTEKVVNEISDKLNLLPKIVEIKEGFGNKYVFQFPTETYDEPVIIQPVWENNTGSVEITCTSKKMQELLKKELAQVEKYVDFNKKERNVPTQLGGYRLGDVLVIKSVEDREKGILKVSDHIINKPYYNFAPEGGYAFLPPNYFLYFMNFGKSGGAISFTSKDKKIWSVSLFYNEFMLKGFESKLPDYIREKLVNDVKEIENRLGIKAVTEEDEQYYFHFPSKSKTILVVGINRRLIEGTSGYYSSYAKGLFHITLISENLNSEKMVNIFNKDKAELKAEEDRTKRAKEKAKQLDSFGLN